MCMTVIQRLCSTSHQAQTKHHVNMSYNVRTHTAADEPSTRGVIDLHVKTNQPVFLPRLLNEWPPVQIWRAHSAHEKTTPSTSVLNNETASKTTSTHQAGDVLLRRWYHSLLQRWMSYIAGVIRLLFALLHNSQATTIGGP